MEKSLYGFDTRCRDRRRVENRSVEIKRLWQDNHEMINLSALGYKNVQIADMLGVTPATVSNTVNCELGLHKLSNLRKRRDDKVVDVMEEVQRMLPKALNIYNEILENENQEASIKLRKEVADTLVMDIGGYRAPTKIQAQTHHLTTDDLMAMKERGKQALKDAKILVE